MQDSNHRGEKAGGAELSEVDRLSLPNNAQYHSLNELMGWIIADAQFQSAEYLEETRADCDGE